MHRWKECQEAKAKWKQRWLQLKSVLRNDLVSDHMEINLEILGNQTKAKNIHHFGAEETVYLYSSWNKRKKKNQNIFQWLQGGKDTVLQSHKKLKPGSADEGDTMTAMKQRLVRQNCDCSHPACTVVTSFVHVHMHENIGFPLMLFSQNPMGGARRKNQTSLLQQTITVNLKIIPTIFATKLQQFEQPKQQLMKQDSGRCACTLYNRHSNTGVTVFQKPKYNHKAYQEDSKAFPITTAD